MFFYLRLWKRCGEGCSSGSSLPPADAPYFPGGCLPTASDCQQASTPPPPPHLVQHGDAAAGGQQPESWSRGGSLPGAAASAVGAAPVATPSASAAARLSQSGQSSQAASLLGLNKPSGTLPGGLATSLAGFLGAQPSESPPSHHSRAGAGGSISSGTISLRRMEERGRIVDPLQVYDNINLGRRIDPLWPDESWRARGGRNNWKDWLPEEGMEGTVSSESLQFSLSKIILPI